MLECVTELLSIIHNMIYCRAIHLSPDIQVVLGLTDPRRVGSGVAASNTWIIPIKIYQENLHNIVHKYREHFLWWHITFSILPLVSHSHILSFLQIYIFLGSSAGHWADYRDLHLIMQIKLGFFL